MPAFRLDRTAPPISFDASFPPWTTSLEIRYNSSKRFALHLRFDNHVFALWNVYPPRASRFLDCMDRTFSRVMRLKVLGRLPSESVQCVVTSPPYWGLRDYEIQGQIGLEPTLDEFLGRSVAVFQEVKRVLKQNGTLWLNIGDGFTSGNRRWRANDKKNPARAMDVRPDTPEGLKTERLAGDPLAAGLLAAKQRLVLAQR